MDMLQTCDKNRFVQVDHVLRTCSVLAEENHNTLCEKKKLKINHTLAVKNTLKVITYKTNPF